MDQLRGVINVLLKGKLGGNRSAIIVKVVLRIGVVVIRHIKSQFKRGGTDVKVVRQNGGMKGHLFP